MFLAGCSTLEQRAETAAVADGVSTAAGVALGLTEMNPLGLATIVVKIPLLAYVHTLPEGEQAAFNAMAGPVWGGAAVSNVCMIAALLSGGAFAPVCLVAGIGYGGQQWNANAAERDFYVACSAYRQASGETFRCVFKA